MKRISPLLLLLFTLTISLSAQRVRLSKGDKDLQKSNTYLGSGKGLHFFTPAHNVVAYNDAGQEVKEFKVPFILKYDGQSMDLTTHVIWDGEPYYLGRSKYNPARPNSYVIFKMTDDGKISEDEGKRYGTIQLRKNGGNVVHIHEVYTHIDGDNLYVANLLYGSTKKDDFPINLLITKIDKNLNSTTLFEQQIDGHKVLGLRNFAFSPTAFCFTKDVVDQPETRVFVDIPNKILIEEDESISRNGKRSITYAHFVHPTSHEVYDIGGVMRSDGSKSFFVRKPKVGPNANEVLEYDKMSDLPSYDLTVSYTEQWKYGSNFGDQKEKDILGLLQVDNVFADDAGNLIIVYKVYVYTKVVGENTFIANALGNETLVRSIDPNTLKENWRVLIPKVQDPSSLESSSRTNSAFWIGILSFPYKDGVLIVYNDSHKNAKAGLDPKKIQTWKVNSETKIVGVYVNKDGVAKKAVLSNIQGLNITLREYSKNLNKPLSISDNKQKPFLYVVGYKEAYIGEVD